METGPALNCPDVVIVSESPPPAAGRPATGLGLRHARMARALAARGARVVYAWPRPNGEGGGSIAGAECVAFGSSAELAGRVDQCPGPVVVVLGFWGLADWLTEVDAPVVLDHVAPRVLERQFEDRDRLAAEIEGLVPVLARCERVWVGNERQRDLMLAWMLLAGHDCREAIPVSVVPIAGEVVEAPSRGRDGPLKLFHGGRDWPWRDATRWLRALADGTDWTLVDAGESAGLLDPAGYRGTLAGCDLALELADDNTERRFSQSFRAVDALCAGVPLVCNEFLPIAAAIREYRAGWTVGSPDQLVACLERIAAGREERDRRAANALELARARFDADRVYGALVDELAAVAAQAERPRRQPLLSTTAEPEGQGGWVGALKTWFGLWVHHRLRRPFHRWLKRRMADRPRPDPAAGRSCWVVVSRPDIFPTDHGAAVKIERTARGLSFHVGEVVLLTDRRHGYWIYRQGRREYRRFPLWPRLAGWPRAVNLVRVMARGLPYSNAFLYLAWVDRGLQARLAWLMRRHPVEVVQAEFPAYARPAVWAARLFGTRSLLVEHNVEFRRIAEQVGDLGEAARRRLKRIEVDLANACDRVVTVSSRDRRELIGAGVREALVETIPHGVDLEAFERAGPVDLRARYAIPAGHAVLVYHGIYSYPPNLEAVEEAALKLLPELARAGHPATLVAIGPEPPERSFDGVVFTGPVEDLAGCLKGGDLALIPLRAGGGTRMKILDDFAAGVPVITTSKGMEGLPVTHGRELLVHDEPGAMVEAAVSLLTDPARREALTGAARAFVADLDWREIARRYVELMRGGPAAAFHPGRRDGHWARSGKTESTPIGSRRA